MTAPSVSVSTTRGSLQPSGQDPGLPDVLPDVPSQDAAPVHRQPLLTRLIEQRYPVYALSLGAALCLWEIAARWAASPLLPGPAEVLHQLVLLSQQTMIGKTLWGHIGASLQRVLIGWGLAVVLAIPLGIVMALNATVNALVKPVFDLLKPIPAIAWISISILWFGLGEESKVFIIAIGSFVPCLLNTYNGVRLIDPALYDVSRMLGATRRQEMIEVDVHACIPAIFAGLQISFSIAWSCVLAAEMVGARSGLGFLIILGMKQSKPGMIIGGMVVIALTAWLFSALLGRLERLACPWIREGNA